MQHTLFDRLDAAYLVESEAALGATDLEKLKWMLGAQQTTSILLKGPFIGPRKTLISPWSTNASEIAKNVGISGIYRLEEFLRASAEDLQNVDPMVQEVYPELCANSLIVEGKAAADIAVENISAFNVEAGLALSVEEITYLEGIARELGRPLSDSELFGFAQVNSEHCRHKIFNGTFIIDGKEQPKTLFQLIKETSKHAPTNIVSAYKDNVAFLRGPAIEQFAPDDGSMPSNFSLRKIESVLSLKAETHNFPTTVEPFAGASTGAGGEIRDRMAGGRGSIPLAGTAVYMTAYPRLSGSLAQRWEKHFAVRNWKYQTPQQILIKASNGASDFGNKFGQPLIAGSLLTFEGETPSGFSAYDRCIMLAGGIGYAAADQAVKDCAKPGDKIVLLGGDNYRIGMAGGSVSSVSGGQYSTELELSAVQRANPEMQKRVFNVIRALCEAGVNPIKLVHDHGAGGHMNCLSELLEDVGGVIHLAALPIGDQTLAHREIICNESQERMGLIVPAEALPLLKSLAEREHAPFYVVGEVDGSRKLVFEAADGSRPIDLPLSALLGSSPKTIIEDEETRPCWPPLNWRPRDGVELLETLKLVLSLESVACKDWLTNKVDRSVTGRIAAQQCVGPLQLPLGNVGVVTLDFSSHLGLATALGHASIPGLIDERAGAVLSLAEALTNLVWAPLSNGLRSVALSANWMWPAKRAAENTRLYRAVEALSQAAMALNIPIPTGKDSLSMTMKYPSGQEVQAPGTVIISAVAEVSDVRNCVTPDLKPVTDSILLWVNLSGLNTFPLGGSALAQVLAELGAQVPTVANLEQFSAGFAYLQRLIGEQKVLAGHDVSAGGLLGALCEMAFAGDVGLSILPPEGSAQETSAFLFCEKPGVLLQVSRMLKDEVEEGFRERGLDVAEVAKPLSTRVIQLHAKELSFSEPLSELRKVWFKPSMLFDAQQTRGKKEKERFENFERHKLSFTFPPKFSGAAQDYDVQFQRSTPRGVQAAIIREKGTNGDREMAFSLFAAGFDVRDVTMSDLMSGRETLQDVSFIVFPGGFSNSDVLGAGRGWAGAFRYNERAYAALQGFFARPNTLSLGVCNGCQLMVALDLLYPDHSEKMCMQRNDSGKFESAFLTVEVGRSNSVMLRPLEGARLGIWVAHGEGRFHLPKGETNYDIPLRYVTASYPANPNGAEFNAAAVVSRDGRHLAMMPHLERSIIPWQWPYYLDLDSRRTHEVTPWVMAFVAARRWIEEQ